MHERHQASGPAPEGRDCPRDVSLRAPVSAGGLPGPPAQQPILQALHWRGWSSPRAASGRGAKVTCLGSTPRSLSHFMNVTCWAPFRPGTPTRLPRKSAGASMPAPSRASTPAVMFCLDWSVVPDTIWTSTPPSLPRRNTGGVSVPTWSVPPTIAPAMVDPTGTSCSVTSSPRLAKNPWSLATKAGTNARRPARIPGEAQAPLDAPVAVSGPFGDLTPLLAPRSVAVIGASDREGNLGGLAD
jgi:hypothetical protein